MWRACLHSIRGRLLIWLGLLVGGILVWFGGTAYQLNRVLQQQQLDEALQRRLAAVSIDLRGGPGPGGDGESEPGRMDDRGERPQPRPEPPSDRTLHQERREPPPDGFRRGVGVVGSGGEKGPSGPEARTRSLGLSATTASQFDENDVDGFYYAVWSASGGLMKASANAPTELARPLQGNRDTQAHVRTWGEWRESFQYTERGDTVVVGRSVRRVAESQRSYAWWLLGTGGFVLLIGLGGGWLVVSRALRPITRISGTAERISAGALSERIDVAETDSELGRLAAILNATFARLDAAFAEQRRFTGDAAHELRTPLAVMISETQTALARERSAADYRETVEGCLETAQSMRKLTDSLLQLARFDAGQEGLERSEFDLAEAARTSIELMRSFAESKGVELVERMTGVVVTADFDRINRVIVNLLDNAIRFSSRRGVVEVAVAAVANGAIVRVTDHGAGIAAEDLPHLFERFYRADKARTQAGSHSGLGLSICKSIIEAHGGTITVESQPGAGANFVVTLPA